MAKLDLKLGGTAVVACVHGRVKRSVVELEFDSSKEHIQMCPCCENLFTKESDEPGRCPRCAAGRTF